MPIDLITRAEWKALAPRGTADHLARTRGVKVHYTGGRVDPRLAEDHTLCAAAVRGIQRGHQNGNGWIDIGYSFAVCPHRKVFEGRGLHRLPAANGPGLNAGHYAILGLVGNSGLVVPPPAMLHGIRDAIEHVRRHGGAGPEIKGHRDGYSTDCPGPELYRWVRAGAPRPEEDDVDIDAIWHDARIKLNKGEKGEESISPAAYLQEIETGQDRTDARLDRVEAKLDQLLAKLNA
ncbi:hypothetical protein [Nonomuraea sp. NPDC023979]|uniref:hypothetical protein n=1 Tax=Nonomuraea sp. NPDC023979 TaxID=3154796 RepID=UPI0033C32C0D